MKYFIVILPKSTDGTINRQILEFTDYEEAKQSFHFQCGKYFNNNLYIQASVCLVDELCNKLMADSWVKPTE